MDVHMNQQQRDALIAFAFSLVPGLPCVIAGGFAAQWWSAGDLDLWVLNDPMLERTTDVWKEHNIRFKTMGESQGSVPEGEMSRSVAVLHTPLMSIHVIGVEETSVAALLDTFDISTHRWGILRNGQQVAGTHATTPFETGRVLLRKFPESTDRRVKRLEERYDIKILPYVPPKKVKKETAA